MDDSEKLEIEKKIATLEGQIQKQLITIKIISRTLLLLSILSLYVVRDINKIEVILNKIIQSIDHLTNLIL